MEELRDTIYLERLQKDYDFVALCLHGFVSHPGVVLDAVVGSSQRTPRIIFFRVSWTCDEPYRMSSVLNHDVVTPLGAEALCKLCANSTLGILTVRMMLGTTQWATSPCS